MHRIRRRYSGSYTLTEQVTDSEGAASAVSEPTAVTIHDGAGALVCETVPTVTAEGALTCAVPAADLPLLDVYEARWTGTAGGEAQEWRTFFELVGGFIFEVAGFREFRVEFAADARNVYSTARLIAARSAAEDRFERGAQCAFVARGRRVRLQGDGSSRLILPDVEVRRVYSASVDGVAVPVEMIDVQSSGILTRTDGLDWAGRRTVAWQGVAAPACVEVHYEHGMRSVPDPIRVPVMVLASEYLVPSGMASRATSQSTDIGAFRLSIAGRDGYTGIPEVDAAMDQCGHRRPVAG